MSNTVVIADPRQRLGRRLGLEPYYQIVEQAPGRLVLASRPERNRRAAITMIGSGAALLLLATLIVISGLINASAGGEFATAALAAALGGLLGGLGYQRIVGGYAVLTTHNRIIFDAEAAAVTFSQGSRVGRPREQRLPFDHISGLRLRRRPLATGVLRRIRPIVVLELIAGAHVWIVDSAADAAMLQETAAAVAAILGRSFDTA